MAKFHAVCVLVVFIVQELLVFALSHPFSENHQVHNEVSKENLWRLSAVDALTQKLKLQPNLQKAKNLILFLGDGWDVQTLTAARVLKGQQVDKLPFGEEASLHLETFPSVGLSKTYCADKQVADSACSATAYLGGVKSNFGTIGVTADVEKGDCSAQEKPENQVDSILAWAQAAGKSTGIVTTTRVTHASPAGSYAHVANRKWECDEDVRKREAHPDRCSDIAEQLVLSEPGLKIDVILGGGRKKFLPKSVKDSEGKSGERRDGKNLIESWKFLRTDVNASYVESLRDLEQVDPSRTDSLLGLFASSHLAYYHDQENDEDPGLATMTEKAIQILSKNPNGFFLFVEGGRIDHAHHDNQALRSLWETIEFDRAVQKGDEMTSDTDTMLVVTADHAHTMSFSGYASRGNKITGIAGTGQDKLPYSTLNYANGPGFKSFSNGQRYNISRDNLDSLKTQQRPLVHLDEETHGGHDVPIFAKGPFSHLLSGVHEQNYIPYAMAYAACIGNGPKMCSEK